ncbi:MAG TPA: vitamin K epoxide reductase family protein [Streptosporangiaceae bacterium]|nr:vitamin K epoxide reductase family protein [Streptosporangiaceae bacterium]
MTASKSARARNARTARSGARGAGAGRTATAGRDGGPAATAGRDGGPAGSGGRPGARAMRGGPRPRTAGDEALAAPAAATPEAAGAAGPAPWFQLTTLALALAGLGVSAYETYAHFNGSHLAGCSATGAFDCTAVITSPQSMVFGVIPVAILGLAFYVFVVAIMTPWAWRMRRREVAWLRLAAMVAGMGFVVYLIYAELFQIGSICEYCTAVHAITFLLFMMTVFAAAAWGLGPARRR